MGNAVFEEGSSQGFDFKTESPFRHISCTYSFHGGAFLVEDPGLKTTVFVVN
jgi:hypothetical protein